MFTYNGISATSKGVKVTDVRRGILPPISLETLDTDSYGTYLIDKKYGPRLIEVDIFLTSNSNLRQQVRDIATWLHSYVSKDLIFDDESDKKYLATLDGDTNLEEIVKTGSGTLNFYCPDPRSISLTKTTTTLTLNTDVNVVYPGSAEVFPILNATLSSTATYITFQVTQPDGTLKKVRSNFSFASGTVIKVDMNEGSIFINGTENDQTFQYDISEYWEIFNGTNKVKILSDGTISSGSIEYYSNWL
jgi:predicted phage tail component-like protein